MEWREGGWEAAGTCVGLLHCITGEEVGRLRLKHQAGTKTRAALGKRAIPFLAGCVDGATLLRTAPESVATHAFLNTGNETTPPSGPRSNPPKPKLTPPFLDLYQHLLSRMTEVRRPQPGHCRPSWQLFRIVGGSRGTFLRGLSLGGFRGSFFLGNQTTPKRAQLEQRKKTDKRLIERHHLWENTTGKYTQKRVQKIPNHPNMT